MLPALFPTLLVSLPTGPGATLAITAATLTYVLTQREIDAKLIASGWGLSWGGQGVIRAEMSPRVLAKLRASGCGYITYMTFVIAWMKGRQYTPPEIGLFWGSLGLAIIASPYL